MVVKAVDGVKNGADDGDGVKNGADDGDGVKNGADDGDGVMLSGLSLCEDAVKGFSAAGKLKREVVFCARLEALRDRRCC